MGGGGVFGPYDTGTMLSNFFINRNSGIARVLEEKSQAPIETLSLGEKIRRLDASSPEKLLHIPDYTATITGWRGWCIQNGKLSALGMTGIWEPKKINIAQCNAGGGIGGAHEAPFDNCRCGFWAFKTLPILEQALKSYEGSVKVVGMVEMWGRVIECQNGWRAQYAYPKELWLLGRDHDYLSWTYGVPVRRIYAH